MSISFDYLWWLLTAYCMIRLVKSDNPRWWIGIGAAIGLGLMTKYTIIYLAAGVAVGVLATKARRHLKSPWLWGGVGLSLLIFLPNILWQINHDFISLEFLSAIHERDVEIGRADGYFSQQLLVNANPTLIFLWVIGIYYYFFDKEEARFRAVGWMFLIPLLLFWLSSGRFYYMAPAYPMLIAAGAVLGERWMAQLSEGRRRAAYGAVYVLAAVGAIISVVLTLPVFPINSDIWNLQSDVHDNFTEQIGWETLTETVASLYADALPDNPSLGILAGNYGEAAAINLYGEQYGLPPVISPINSYWYRGFGAGPQAVIAVGFSQEELETFFTQCEVIGQNENEFGVVNEESAFHRDIFFCSDPQVSWEVIWPQAQRFG